jgi:hypothetical protein
MYYYEGNRDSRKLEEHVDLTTMCAAFDEAIHHVHHPRCAFSARCTLTAGLMLVELN